MAGNSAPRGAAARLPHTVPRFLISWSAIKGNACARSEFRELVRRKTSKSFCLQHAPTPRLLFKSMKSRLPTPLMSTRCSGRSVPFWINGRRVCPPAKIRARDPHSERISSTSSIEVGAEYVTIPGLFGHPSNRRGFGLHYGYTIRLNARFHSTVIRPAQREAHPCSRPEYIRPRSSDPRRFPCQRSRSTVARGAANRKTAERRNPGRQIGSAGRQTRANTLAPPRTTWSHDAGRLFVLSLRDGEPREPTARLEVRWSVWYRHIGIRRCPASFASVAVR